jgi:Tfp pilus assembly protein PilO
MPMGQAGMLFVFGFFLLITVIVIAVIFSFASTSKAKASAAREGAYRELAEKASLDAAELKASLIEIKSRLASVERMLKEVE